MFRRDYNKILERTLDQIEGLNYCEQFLEIFPDFFSKQLPVSGLSVFTLNHRNTEFVPHLGSNYAQVNLESIDWNSNLVTYLKNSGKPIVFKEEKPSRLRFLKKTNRDLFDQIPIDIALPLFSFNKLHGFVTIEANGKTHKELHNIEGLFRVVANIVIPMVKGEQAQMENNRNYYRIYRMDRLAMVGELAASAAHEIKNPLAGISTFLKYFIELEDFTKDSIIDELNIMRQSVQRIDEIIKSLLSFSRYKKREIVKVNLTQLLESSLQSMALKIPPNITIVKKIEEENTIETDPLQLQQVLINILFNSVEAIGKNEGEIVIHIYVSGRDQLPSTELFNISVRDNGPGIDDAFKEKLFQPFQTTKEEGTGLGLYTCYGLMKSLGGTIKIDNPGSGTEVLLSLPYSFDDEVIE
jgi:signal transduction histidine kinase